MSTIQATGQPVRIAGLAADDYGRSDDRPPLVLLHGMTFNRTTWRDIVPELQRIDPGRRSSRSTYPGTPVARPGDLRAWGRRWGSCTGWCRRQVSARPL